MGLLGPTGSTASLIAAVYSRGWLESVSQIITCEFALALLLLIKMKVTKTPGAQSPQASAGLIVNPVVQEDADQYLAIIIYLELS